MMEEKYTPVCKGSGLYFNHKVKYSPETHIYLKKLLDESKLSILQRQSLQQSIKDGNSIPGPGNKKKGQKLNKNEIIIQPTALKKRTQKAILESGAYEREQFSPVNNKANYDKEKQRLQNMMAYGKEVSDETARETIRLRAHGTLKTDEPCLKEDNMYDHLLLEVEEREEFLEEMDRLGEGKKYKDVIELEIMARLRRMELVDKERYSKQKGTVEKYRIKRGPPKALPITAVSFPDQ